MLCQLVCVDRRYQRMNCFNIRELQGNLKRKFFSDLVNSNDHREVLNNTMIGLRFKTQDMSSLNPDLFSFYQYGTHNNSKSRNLIFTNTYDVNNNFSNISYNLNSINLSIISFLTTKTPLYFFHQVTILLNEIEMHIYRILSSFNVLSLLNFSSLKLNLEFFFESFLNVSLPSLSEFSLAFKNRNFYEQFNKLSFFKSDNGKLSDLETLYSGIESSTYTRSNKFMNSYVSYDYKCGNYLGI
jgi:hypothetical protein